MKVAMGNDYFATYGQIINPQYEVGQTVEAGSVIGYVNKPTSSYEKEGDNLYFQVTKKNKPNTIETKARGESAFLLKNELMTSAVPNSSGRLIKISKTTTPKKRRNVSMRP